MPPFIREKRDFGHHRRGILALALEHADLLGQAVAPCLEVLGAGLQFLAFSLQGGEGSGVQADAAGGQPFGYKIELAAQQLDV